MMAGHAERGEGSGGRVKVPHEVEVLRRFVMFVELSGAIAIFSSCCVRIRVVNSSGGLLYYVSYQVNIIR